MRVLKVFLLGLLYGWFMRWIIDEIYVKDNLRMITNENAMLRDRIKLLEVSKSLAPQSVKRTPTPTPQPDQRPQPVARASVPARAASSKDDFKKIKGVGPVMEKKLNAAGINTFEQFSRLTTQELQNILGISKRVVQSANNLIMQARKLAQQKMRNR